MTKEILKDEIMSEKELEQVAGGYNHETSQDSLFLNDMGTGCDRYGEWKVSVNYGHCCDDIAKHWGQFGITVTMSNPVLGDWCGDPNIYYLNGKKISRNDAMRYVANALGKTVDVSKYA